MSDLDFDIIKSKEYSIDAMLDNTVYANKAKCDLPSSYYLVPEKDYPDKNNT